jgi:hypothetical protein
MGPCPLVGLERGMRQREAGEHDGLGTPAAGEPVGFIGT